MSDGGIDTNVSRRLPPLPPEPPVVDVEAKVTRFETEGSEELRTAQDLVDRVLEEKKLWAMQWHDVVLNPAVVHLEDFPPGTVGISEGSCRLLAGERELAKFIVRFREDPLGVELEADYPSRKWDEEVPEGPGTHTVMYEEVGGRVAYACEELNLEGWASNVEAMKRQLVARYGMRFRFNRA